MSAWLVSFLRETNKFLDAKISCKIGQKKKNHESKPYEKLRNGSLHKVHLTEISKISKGIHRKIMCVLQTYYQFLITEFHVPYGSTDAKVIQRYNIYLKEKVQMLFWYRKQ